MIAVNDNDLILFHYRDGLDEARLAQIDAALQASAELRARYARLCRVLVDADAEPPAPPAGFENRLWSNFDKRIANQRAEVATSGIRVHLRAFLESMRGPRLAWAVAGAFAVMLALGVAFQAGRYSAPLAPAEATASAPSMADRVLEGYVAGHLRATEGLLMTAVNDDGGELLDGNRKLAAALVDSNRMYALAAAGSGNARLADFLRQLEPVLLEVANQPASSTVEDMQGLRDYLRNTDLLFQVRATESRMDVASKRSL